MYNRLGLIPKRITREKAILEGIAIAASLPLSFLPVGIGWYITVRGSLAVSS